MKEEHLTSVALLLRSIIYLIVTQYLSVYHNISLSLKSEWHHSKLAYKLKEVDVKKRVRDAFSLIVKTGSMAAYEEKPVRLLNYILMKDRLQESIRMINGLDS